jgi:nitrite reductase (NADH) large subunit
MGRSLGWTSCLAAFLALLILLTGSLPPSNVMGAGWTLDVLWRESFWQQVSGYALVGLVVAGLSFSLRKRWRRLTFINYQAWRLVHAFLGSATLLILILHTGLRLGTGLNLLLMADHLGLCLTGAAIGGLTALGQALRVAQLRAWIFNIHLGLLWVFPVLLGFHILAVYYY